jgi:uncharacterized protein (TIGR02996 family)
MAKAKKPAADPWDVAALEAKAGAAKTKAAREVLKKGGFGAVERRADGQGWWVVCKGLTGSYEVSVKRGPRGGLESRCTCPSTQRPCKHAMALLLYLAEHPEARPEEDAPVAKPERDFETLLRAAFADPKDDTTRLVLADFIEERGQPDRAALIRIQCALRRPATSSEEHAHLQSEQTRLTRKLQKELGPFPKGYQGKFERGFLHFLCMGGVGGDAIPDRFMALFRDAWVEELRVHAVVKSFFPLFRLVGTVDLTVAYCNDDDLTRLAAGLEWGHPETRTRAVKLAADVAERYRALGGQGAVS